MKLKEAGLKVTGKKAVLVDRLLKGKRGLGQEQQDTSVPPPQEQQPRPQKQQRRAGRKKQQLRRSAEEDDGLDTAFILESGGDEIDDDRNGKVGSAESEVRGAE